MTTEHPADATGDVHGSGRLHLPEELLAASHRRAANRAQTIRSLGRSRTRRRIMPTVVVTSVAILGAGAANAYVNSTIAVPTTTTTSPAAANLALQSAANAQTLARVSAALAADRQTLASLLQSAASARALLAASPTAAGPSTAATPIASSPAPVVSAPAAAPAPTPAPVVHATTGASGAG
ncbi:MAG: hypothetical protein HKL86_08135 [Acidimicrobiaceae bacterium]|nr:hypothetical protein [Acidimicrobiaceae bacterium]